jgi:hypothetical protein
MKKSVNNIVLSTLTAAFLVGCGSSSTTSSSTSASGASQKGPFKAEQTVTAQKLLANGSVDSSVAVVTTQTDNLGKFKFSAIPWSGATEFKVEGEYLDESTGEYVPGGLLTAVTNVESGTAPKVNINILTHIAAENIKQQMANNVSIEEAKEKAKEVIKTVFKIDLSEGTDLEDLDITDGADDTNKVANTQLLKISAALTKTEDPAKALDNLVEDLSDGEVDDEAEETFKELKEKEAEVKLDEVAQNIKAAIKTTDVTALASLPDNDDVLSGTMSLKNNVDFTPILEAETTTTYESNIVTVDGIYGTTGATISISGGLFSINGAEFSSTSTTINNGDTLQLQATTSASYDTKTSVVVTIGGVDFNLDLVTKNDPFVADTKIKAFEFVSKTAQSLSSLVESDAVTIDGINTTTAISVDSGTEYAISTDSGTSWSAFTSTAGTVENGNQVKVRHTTSSDYLGRVKSTVTFGSADSEVVAYFKTYTLAQDKTPDTFTFTTKYDTEISTDTTPTYVDFDIVTLAGVTGSVQVKIDDGEYKIDSGDWTSADGTISNDSVLTVRQKASEDYNEKTTSRLIVGTKIVEFSSYTKAEPQAEDLRPTEFKFAPKFNTELSTDDVTTYVEADETITVAGLSTDTEAKITIEDGEYSINGGDWTSEDGVIKNGDTLNVRNIASKENLQKTETELKVGEFEVEFYSFTKAPVDTVPNPFGFRILEAQDTGVEVTSSIQYIRGLNTTTDISITNGYLKVNDGEFVTSATVQDNDKIIVKHTTSSDNDTKTESVITVGNDTDGKFETKFVSITKKTAPVDNSSTPATSVNNGSKYSYTPNVTGAKEFELENAPEWLVMINKRTGELSGTPNKKEYEKTYENIIIKAENDGGEIELAPFNITVNNIAPTITLSKNSITTSITSSSDLTITATGSDTLGDTLTYSLVDAPSFVSIVDNIITIAPSTTVADYTFKVKVSDSDSLSAESEVSLSVVEFSSTPTAPTISGTPVTSVNEDENYLFTPSASDINGDELTFSIENLPSWANFDPKIGSLTGIPSNNDVGTYSNIIITVDDGTHTTSLDSFNIEVVNVNDAPTGSSISNQNISLDDVSSYSLDVTTFFNDVDANDTLTYDVTFASGELLPSWLSFTSNILSVNGILDSSYAGDYEMKVTATDKSGEKAVINFTLSVQKDKFTQALDIIDSIDPELEDIDTKLSQAKALLDTLSSSEAKVVGILISIAEIANNQAISNLIFISNETEAYSGSNLNALVRNSVMDFVNIDDLIKNESTSNLSSTATTTIHDIATNLKSLSDELANYFKTNSDSYSYNGETMTYDDANALRATALAVAFKLENLSAYQWGEDSDFAVRNLEGNEFTKIDVDPASVLNSGNFFKLVAGNRVETAKTYLVEALDMASKIPVGYDNGSMTQDDLNLIGDLKAAFAGNGQYTITDFDETDEVKSVTIDLNKMFSSTTALSINDLGSSWTNSCSGDNGTLYAGVDDSVATYYGYAICEYSTNYGMWTEDAELDPEVLPTSTTSKIDDIVLNITLRQDSKVLMGQDLIDYLIDDEEEPVNNSIVLNDIIGQKLAISDTETYYFTKEGLVLGDSGEDYTETATVTEQSDGTIKVLFDDGAYDILAKTDTGYTVTYYLSDNSNDGSDNITTDFVSYLETELDTVLADVAPTSPSAVTYASLDGKKILRNNGFYYYFLKGKVYRGDADTSNFDSFGWTEEFTYQELSDGTLKLIASWGDYDILSANSDGTYSITSYDTSGYSSSISSNSTSVEYTEDEISILLDDVPTRMTAVDPYISMANFCADLNSNNSCDTDEPISTYSSENGEFMFNTLIAEGTPILINEKGTHLGEEFDGDIKAYAGDGTVISPLTTMEVNGFTQTQVINLLENYGIGITNFNLDPFKPFAENNVQSYDYADLQATIAVHTFLKMTDYGLTPSVAFDQYGDLAEPYASAMNLATLLIKSTINETLVSTYSSAEPKYIIYTAVAIANYLVDKVATMEQSESGTGFSYLSSYLGDSTNVSAHIGLLANAYMNDSSKFYELNSDGTTAVEVGTQSDTTDDNMSTTLNIDFGDEVATATVGSGTQALFSSGDLDWLDKTTFNASTLSIEMYEDNGNGYEAGSSEVMDITYPTSTSIGLKDDSGNVAVICTNSETVKVNAVNNIVYSDLYRSKNTCVNETVSYDDSTWSWDWNSLNEYTNDVNGLISVFTTGGAYFEHANTYFKLSSDNNVYVAVQDGYWPSGDEKIVSTTTVAGQWNSDSDSINIAMNNTYKFNAEVTLNSNNQIVFNFEDLVGFTESDYMWTGSSIMDFFNDIINDSNDSSSDTSSDINIDFGDVVTTAQISNGITTLIGSGNLDWLDVSTFNASTLSIQMYEDNGNGYEAGDSEVMDITYPTSTSIGLKDDSGNVAVICTNSETVKVNAVNNIVYSDLYRSKNTCVNETVSYDDSTWSWDWNSLNEYTNDVNGLISVFTTGGAYFEHANTYFKLSSDNNVYVAVQDGYWPSGDEKIVSTTTVAGQWNSDSDIINIAMNNTYKFNAEVTLDSNNQIVFNFEDLVGFTESDYMWTGSSVLEFFEDITGINPLIK